MRQSGLRSRSMMKAVATMGIVSVLTLEAGAQLAALRYEVVKRHPQDPGAFTQGTLLRQGWLDPGYGKVWKVLDSAGRPCYLGRSSGDGTSIRGCSARAWPGTGIVSTSLTWKAGLVLKYDAASPAAGGRSALSG